MHKEDQKIECLRGKAVKRLSLSGIDYPETDVDYFLSHIKNKDRSWIHAHGDESLSDSEVELFLCWISRREAREPLHYILGRCPFWDFDVNVGHGCLIPRPETEFLVEAALETFSGGLFADWGTGTGCISIALLKERANSFAWAVEKNPLSLVTAYRNFREQGLLSRCHLWHSRTPTDIPLKADCLDLIISNPPYIPELLVPDLMPEVSCHEPRLALDGGSDGLDPYRMLLPWGKRTLKRGGWLWTEIGGDDQVAPLMDLTPEGLFLEKIIPDLSGITRVLGWRRV